MIASGPSTRSGRGGHGEYELFLVLTALAVTLTGPGGFAADRLLPGPRTHRFSHSVAAVPLGAVAACVTLLLRD